MLTVPFVVPISYSAAGEAPPFTDYNPRCAVLDPGCIVTHPQVCEKALADYMESKRRAFPRFYFVSTADLLDILSNGNSPHKVRPLAAPAAAPDSRPA